MAGINLYSERIRMAMKTSQNSTGRPISIRELATYTSYSYENVRKVCSGEHDGSREFNQAVCSVLGFNENEMWQLAQVTKAQRRLGLSVLATLPRDARLIDIWPRLTEQDREILIRIAEGYALASEALATSRVHSPLNRSARALPEREPARLEEVPPERQRELDATICGSACEPPAGRSFADAQARCADSLTKPSANLRSALRNADAGRRDARRAPRSRSVAELTQSAATRLQRLTTEASRLIESCESCDHARPEHAGQASAGNWCLRLDRPSADMGNRCGLWAAPAGVERTPGEE